MATFRTKLGTELPLLQLKGKDYLQAAHRIQWFREEKPGWTIETDCISTSPESSIFKATIKDESGRVIATAHKSETAKGFPDHMEKSETGAISRALALCGYGTQFAQELDEGERLADSPLPRAAPKPVESSTNGEFVFNFGKFKGQSLSQVGKANVQNYLDFLRKAKPGEPESPAMKAMAAYLESN